MKNKREEVQKFATDSIIKANYNGIIDIAPRVGKSKIIIDAIRDKSDWNIVISSPFDSVKKSWLKEINLWKLEFNPSCICSKSLKKIPENLDLLILDEFQMLSINELVTIKKKNPKRILLVSGTINHETKSLASTFFNSLVIFSYSIEQAIQDSIIAGYSINIIRINLNNTDKNIVSGTKKFPKTVTEQEHYNFLTQQFEKFKILSYSNYSYSSIKDMYARKRKTFIYQSKTKLECCKSIIEKSDRCLVFTGFIQEAEYLCDKSYTVKNKKEDNLQKLINEEIDKLSVINMSSVGITVPKLKHVIVHQCQSNDEMSLQKILRACNLDENKEARIDVLCYKNTVDEEWTKSAFSSVKKERIKYIDWEEYQRLDEAK